MVSVLSVKSLVSSFRKKFFVLRNGTFFGPYEQHTINMLSLFFFFFTAHANVVTCSCHKCVSTHQCYPVDYAVHMMQN